MTKNQLKTTFTAPGLLAGILFISLNLRASISSVGPLLEPIGEFFRLSKAASGLLTSLPLLAFALLSYTAPFVSRKFGIGKTLAAALLLLTVGIFIRSLGTVFFLFTGTLLLGLAIALGNVLIPGVIKQKFPEKAGLVTGLQSALMALGSTIAAALSLPLANHFGLGWQGSLAVWGIPVVLAFALWIPQLKHLPKTPVISGFKTATATLLRSRSTWLLAFYMGFQSLTFYTVLAWLPDMLKGFGHSSIFSAQMLALSQAISILGSLFFPAWAARKGNLKAALYIMAAMEILALLGLWLSASPVLVILWIILIGLVVGGTFGIALLLIVYLSSDAKIAASLSGFVQSFGYSIAATGPLLVGLIQDMTGRWQYSLFFLLGIGFIKLYFGVKATAKKQI